MEYRDSWEWYILCEIEAGERAAIALAGTDPTYDHGISGMHIWFIFECDARGEEGREQTNDTPWGPMYEPEDFARWVCGASTCEDMTDEELEADEELVRHRAELEELEELDRKLRRRP